MTTLDPTPPQPRPRLVRSLGAALLTLLAIGMASCLAGVAVLAAVPDQYWLVFAFPVVFAIYVGAGVLAWWRRPASRTGLLILAGGYSLAVASLTYTAIPAFVVIGMLLATVPFAVVVHLLLSFPDGRLPGRRSRIITIAAYVTCVVLQAPIYLFGSRGPFADAPAASTIATIDVWLQRLTGVAIAAVTAAVLIRRFRAAPPTHRRVLGPLYGYGIAVIVVITIAPAILGMFGIAQPASGLIQLAALAGIPIAFTIGVIAGGYERTAELEELATWLGETGGGADSLRRALSRALGDPGLDIAFWLPVRDGFVDENGREVVLPHGRGRESLVVESGGEVVGAIIYDSGIVADPEQAHDAARVAALAFVRERLTADLMSSRDALRRSRQRFSELDSDGRQRTDADPGRRFE